MTQDPNAKSAPTIGSLCPDLAKAGELCCKNLVVQRYLEEGEEMPVCGESADFVIVTDSGERLPFCSKHFLGGER